MPGPIYEVGIYTYKSPLALNASDVIAVRDVTKDRTSIGINTIGDYDKYYVSTTNPTFNETFVPKTVGTIDDAFMGNSGGNALSISVVNSLKVENASLVIEGYNRPIPIVVGAELTISETFTPEIDSFSSVLKVPYIPRLTVTNSKINAILYKCVRPRIVRVLYYVHANVSVQTPQSFVGTCGPCTLVGQAGGYYPTAFSSVRVPKYLFGSKDYSTEYYDLHNLHYPDADSIAFPGSESTPNSVIVNQTGFYDYNEVTNAVGLNPGATRGWGVLPSSVINSDSTGVNNLTFYLNRDNNSYVNCGSGGNTTNRGALYLNGTNPENLLVPGGNVGIYSLIFSQFGPSNPLDVSGRIGPITCNGIQCPDPYCSYNYPETMNKRFTFNTIGLAVIASDGSVHTATGGGGSQTDSGIYNVATVTDITLSTLSGKLLQPTNSDVTIPINLAQTIDANEQIELNNFESNNAGVVASKLASPNTEYNFVDQATLNSYFNTAAAGGLNVQPVVTTSPLHEIGKIYVGLEEGNIETDVKYGNGPTYKLTFNSPNDDNTQILLPGGTNSLVVNSDNNNDFKNFMKEVLKHPNFNATRTLNLFGNGQLITASYPSISFSFANLMTQENAVALARNTWSLDLRYIASSVPSSLNFYRFGSNFFPVPPEYTFTTNFNSNGTLATGVVPRGPLEQVIAITEVVDILPFAKQWLRPPYVVIPEINTLQDLNVTPRYPSTYFSLPFVVSLVGDPVNTTTELILPGYVGGKLARSFAELTYPSNKTIRNIDITAYCQSVYGNNKSFGITGTTGFSGFIPSDYIVSSFNYDTNYVQEVGITLPVDFYTTSLDLATLELFYKWGDEYNFTPYAEIIPLGGNIELKRSNFSEPESTVILFNQEEREVVLPTTESNLYFTTISSNKTGYTFSTVPFVVKPWDPTLGYKYKIYNLPDNFDNNSNVTKFLNINSRTIDRNANILFSNVPYSLLNMNKLKSIGVSYDVLGDKVTGLSVKNTNLVIPLINNFIRFDDASVVGNVSGPKSLYFFIYPEIEYTLERPVVLPNSTDICWVPSYTKDAGSIVGIPTLGATAGMFANQKFSDYIVLYEDTDINLFLNTVEMNTSSPFSNVVYANYPQYAISFREFFIRGQAANDPIAREIYKKYFVSTRVYDANRKIYIVPFNWEKNIDSTYNIAYAANYITLDYVDVNPLWPNKNLAQSNFDAYVYVIDGMIEVRIGSIYTAEDFGVTTATLTGFTGSIANATFSHVDPQSDISSGTYVMYFTPDSKNDYIPGKVYDIRSLGYIKPVFSSDVPQSNTILYTLPRFYSTPNFIINNGVGIISASFESDIGLFLTKFNIVINNGNGDLKYKNQLISGSSEIKKRYAIVIPGFPEVLFDIAEDNTAIVEFPFLLPLTTYNEVSLRYYPFRDDPLKSNFSEISQFDQFSFTTPDLYLLNGDFSVNYRTENNRIVDIVIGNIKLSRGADTLFIPQAYTSVFNTGRDNLVQSGLRFARQEFLDESSNVAIYTISETQRGEVITPRFYLQKIVNGKTLRSNILECPTITVPTNPSINIQVTGNLLYKKLVEVTNFDAYIEFLSKDFSLPNEYGGDLVITRGTTIISYGSTAVSGSSPFLYLDLNDVAGGTYTDFKLNYCQNKFDPYAQNITYITNSSGSLDITYIPTTDYVNTLNSTWSVLTTLPFSDNLIIYGDLTDKINIAVNNDMALTNLIEFLYTYDNQTTFYDPYGVYKESDGLNTGVNGRIVSTRLDSQGNTGYNYYLESSSVPTGTTIGHVGVTYLPGLAYAGTESSPFYKNMIGIKKSKPIFIVLLNTGLINLTDYVLLNTPFTSDAIVYNGSVLVKNYNTSQNEIIYRDTFPNYRDSNGVPTYRLNDFFNKASKYSSIYFQDQSQIDAWNTNLINNYWWTSPSIRPPKTCPYQIKNVLIEVGTLPSVVVADKEQVMQGQVYAWPSLFYGAVRIYNFDYYSVDDSNNSYPVVYNGGTLTLVDSSNNVYGSTQVLPVNNSDVAIFLDKQLLTQNTIYDLTIVYTYSDANIVGKATLPVIYSVPKDELDISFYRTIPLIHKINVNIEPRNIFGNLPLSSIVTPSRLTLKNLETFNYQGIWSPIEYALGDAVLWDDILYWLLDKTNFETYQPKYGYGWVKTTNYINYVGDWRSSLILKPNDVVKYNNQLYKVGRRDAIPPRVAPLTIDRSTGLYSDYSTSILDQDVIIPYPYANDNSLNYTFTDCIPNASYNILYSLQVGTTFTDLMSLGNVDTLPTVLNCREINNDGTVSTLSNVSYENSSNYFRDGWMNYNGLTYAFQGTTASQIPSFDSFSNIVVSYTPEVSVVSAIPDQTDPYKLFTPGSALACTIGGPEVTHNSAIFQVANFAAPPFSLSTNDYIGVFTGTTLTTLWTEFQLTDSIIQNNYAYFDLVINGLTPNTYYPFFSFQYRVNNNPFYSGVKKYLKPFRTFPILVIGLSLGIGFGKLAVKVRQVRYCQKIQATLFPITDPRNNIKITLKNINSLKTITAFETVAVTINDHTIPSAKVDITKLTNLKNYEFDFVHVEYTFADITGDLVTYVLESNVPSFVAKPQIVELLL